MTQAETQPERTALAWQRTGLGVLAVGGLLGHRALEQGSVVLVVVAAVVALLGLAVLGGLAPARYRQVQARAAVAPGMVAAATGVVVLVAFAAGAAVLAPN